MNKRKLPGVIVILILSSITVVFWIIFVIYKSVIIIPPTDISKEMLAPISASLDIETVELIKERLYP